MTHRKKKNITTIDLVLIGMFTAVMSICAWISIPMTVPFTMQTFGVFLTLQVLGGRRGTLAVLNYLFLGIVGVPVFSGFQGGIGRLLGNTGGYIVGFLFSALVVWGLEVWLGKRRWVSVLSVIMGLFVCYAFGTIWFVLMYMDTIDKTGVWSVLSWCVFPYIIPDVVKIMLVFGVSERLKRNRFEKQ